MKPIKLKHKDILEKGARAHVTRATLTNQRPRVLHSHTFYEMVWVQNGVVRHHQPNGVTALTEGTLVCLAPGQVHGLQGKGEAAMVATVCLHPDAVQEVASQFPNLTAAFGDKAPGVFQLDINALTALNRAANTLEKSDRDDLATAAFLLPVLSDLVQTSQALPFDLPTWLREACVAAQDSTVFRDGAAGLVARTGKAHPHVSRTMRRYFGQTPSDYINVIRMEHAARALVTDTEPLSEIASDIGIPNLSHFHKLFRARFGVTPLKYRQKYQREVLQP